MGAYPLIILLSSFLPVEPETTAVRVLDFAQFRELVRHKDNDTLYVVNFWATWCKPCVEEMPFFEKAGKEFSGKKVKFIMMSLDFASQLDKVTEFKQLKKLRNEVYLLHAGNPNVWIDEVDPSWSGAIPATVFYKAGNKIHFHEGQYTFTELTQFIQTQIP